MNPGDTSAFFVQDSCSAGVSAQRRPGPMNPGDTRPQSRLVAFEIAGAQRRPGPMNPGDTRDTRVCRELKDDLVNAQRRPGPMNPGDTSQVQTLPSASRTYRHAQRRPGPMNPGDTSTSFGSVGRFRTPPLNEGRGR